tara:strand:- start:951 stop:1094 length:144 start_codon:yes stop_codon:yes gene_type:complete
MLYRWYVEYKDDCTNDPQKHLFVHAKTEKQIEEMFLEYKLITVMIAD